VPPRTVSSTFDSVLYDVSS